ncbi:lipopolysaccharide biosynthesis protein [Alkalicoccobacillus murimartini]|uniref:O-antigen/teichoic acid export membrane protein n=1 Tax=Alkalicoccobacillus murimartini TaxID=171685 RepID=A0ABT9YGJ5_9BACI|nr:oligosaccharide flippase family protein [Alkalicoccobacillus murimartini]MDQ0206988.1 O-antigen/teichoic acid export membrane protein [Alkalicoccobacillus murimartini]
MKSKVLKIFKVSGMRQIITLGTGVLMAQIITILTQPVITRIYSPSEIGLLAIVISTVTMLVPVVTMQYHLAIVSARKNSSANSIIILCGLILILMSIILIPLLISYNRFFPTTFSLIGNWFFIIIPLVFLGGLRNILDSYNNRFEQYKLMSKVTFRKSIVLNFSKILTGLFGLGYIGLIMSQVLSEITGIKSQSRFLRSNIKNFKNIDILEVKKVAIDFKVQPFFSLPGVFATSFSFMILPILIGELFSITETGYFHMGIILLTLPLTLISSNVAKVFFKKATFEKNEKGNFYNTFKSYLTILSLLSLIGFVFLWFTVEDLFALFLGSEWMISGEYVKILIPMFAIRFITTSMMHGFIISGKQLLKLMLQLLFVVSAICIYFISSNMNLPIEIFLKLINDIYLIIYVILLFVLYKTSKKS